MAEFSDIIARMQEQHKREINNLEIHVQGLNDYIEVQSRLIDNMETELRLLREIHNQKP